jgi:hypothetical protein
MVPVLIRDEFEGKEDERDLSETLNTMKRRDEST